MHFHSIKCIWKCRLRNGGHFVSVSMCQVTVTWYWCMMCLFDFLPALSFMYFRRRMNKIKGAWPHRTVPSDCDGGPQYELSYCGNKTGVKQCTFHWLISSELIQEHRVFISLIIYHLIMMTCISYGNIFAKLLPKYINVAPLWTWIFCFRLSDGIYNTDYTCLKWSNSNQFW